MRVDLPKFSNSCLTGAQRPYFPYKQKQTTPDSGIWYKFLMGQAVQQMLLECLGHFSCETARRNWDSSSKSGIYDLCNDKVTSKGKEKQKKKGISESDRLSVTKY